MSVVLDVDENETYPSRFTIFAGASKNQTKLIKDVYVKGNQSTVQLLDYQEEVLQILFIFRHSPDFSFKPQRSYKSVGS